MNVVVDTSVVAYYVLGTPPFFEEVSSLWRTVTEVWAPGIWAAELANVIWMAVRAGTLVWEEGHQRLDYASRLHIRSVSTQTLWHAALARSIMSGLGVYDTLFVELAASRRLPLATFDTGILSAFPDLARRPGELVC
jgi:predicted nucleic acid-binding protein